MLQYNARWAAKLEKQRRMEEERQAAERAEEERKTVSYTHLTLPTKA